MIFFLGNHTGETLIAIIIEKLCLMSTYFIDRSCTFIKNLPMSVVFSSSSVVARNKIGSVIVYNRALILAEVHDKICYHLLLILGR